MINLGAELVHRIGNRSHPEGVAEKAEAVGVFDLGGAGGTVSSAHERIFGTQGGRVEQVPPRLSI
jgi:hypothetical protein